MTPTIKELDELLFKMAEKEKEIDLAKAQLTERNKEFNTLQFRAIDFLREAERESYDSPAGKIEMKETWRVNLPENDIEKTKFFTFLREQGLFDKYATVNSNSLNALYRGYWEEAKAKGEGMTFTLPGIGAPKIDRTPKFKAAKV